MQLYPRPALFQPPEESCIEVEPQVGVHPSLKQQLVTAEGCEFLYLAVILFIGGDISIAAPGSLAEVAKPAMRKTDIGDIDIPVNYPANTPARIQPLPHKVSDVHQLFQWGFVPEGQCLVACDAATHGHPFV